MNTPRKILLAAVSILLAFPVLAPVAAAQAPAVAPAQAEPYALDSKIPVDPRITVGRLPNGLRYWIRENREPKNRAELRLVVNAGSVLEDEDQRGLAHVVEHLAFNGTTHFPQQKLVDFMESIGMRFGSDLNAFTSFDQTLYMLQIPMDSPAIVDNAFLILEDWAHNVTFEPKAVDKERGIILEEWRLGQGADARIRDKQIPILLAGSRYAERLPDGKPEVIANFTYDALRRFYRTWYRPDLMAVIAVGDFDRARIEDLIKRHFGPLAVPPDAAARPVYPVPDHDGTLFALAPDKEASQSVVAVYHKLPAADQSTVGAYRRMLVERLFNDMINERLGEIARKPDPPFLGAISSRGRFVGSKDAYALSALVAEGGIPRGLRALYAEGEKVARFGFTATELERRKGVALRYFERALVEKETQDSDAYAEEFTRAFLEGEPTPGIQFEYDLHKRFLPGITLEEVNALAREWMTDRNRVVMASFPDKPSVPAPAEAELRAVLEEVKSQEIAAYEDTATDAPLIAQEPAPGSIVARREIPAVGVTEWTLSNGARVVLKPTTFKEDEILLRAVSAGGVSLADEGGLIAANTADEVVPAGGLGAFSAVDLEKKLAGKAVNINPSIGELEEGLAASASLRDAETLFQLIYLTFTAPRPDPVVFEAFKAQLKSVLENRTKSPETVFSDTLRTTLQRDQPRFRPMTVDEIPQMDLEKSLAFYRDRFADAGDFTFVLVGNLDLAKIEPLVCRYLASLPALHRTETWKDWRVAPPEGVVKRTVEKGVEPKSLTAIVFSGDFRDDAAGRINIRAAAHILETRLRKLLRETLSGTYDVGVRPGYGRIPRPEFRMSINLGTDPARMEEMTQAIFAEIRKMQKKGPTAAEVGENRLAESRDFEIASRQNDWWVEELVECCRLGTDPAGIVRFPESLKLLTRESIKAAARTYFNTERYVQVTLYPEKK
ncbi:MAG TPA: insulinase family protein [Candidatus Aminicenantes bacterium]|nr:insulinase family protein [Candidatus Aminicenantes bacterium]HRY66136.1 insulinase family protein [Candidatus Aminicenantes bacterium]HRZ73050.1 insulinase family protein [Candidatus Aminicenantes bacterium]